MLNKNIEKKDNKIYKQITLFTSLLVGFALYFCIIFLTDNMYGINAYMVMCIPVFLIFTILSFIVVLLIIAIINELKGRNNKKARKNILVLIIPTIILIAFLIPVMQKTINCIKDFPYLINPSVVITRNIETQRGNYIKFDKNYVLFYDNDIEQKIMISDFQYKYCNERIGELLEIVYYPNTNIIVSIRVSE